MRATAGWRGSRCVRGSGAGPGRTRTTRQGGPSSPHHPHPAAGASKEVVMRRMARALALCVAVFLAVAGCTHHTTPSGGPAPAPPPGPGGSASASPDNATVPGGGPSVVSGRTAYAWRWPNAEGPGLVKHAYPVPPVPQLVAVEVGNHPNDPGERPYNRMSFTFTTTFPTYTFQYVSQLTSDARGQVVPLEGQTVLRILFKQAQAHTDGGGSSVTSGPPAHLGLSRMVSYAQAGDVEGG